MSLLSSVRSTRKHKDWGGAKRNPRVQMRNNSLSSRSERQRLWLMLLSPASRARKNLMKQSWGSRPRLYATVRSADLKREPLDNRTYFT